jgi:hypothetical protein
VGGYDTSGYAQGVAVSGNYAYVADSDGGLVILFAGTSTKGDFDGDGGIGPRDLRYFIERVAGPALQPALYGWSMFDFDGDVDLRDFAEFQSVLRALNGS